MKNKSVQSFSIGSRVFLKSNPSSTDGTVIDLRREDRGPLLTYWREHSTLRGRIAGYQIDELVRES